MSAPRKRAPVLPQKPKEEVNRKAIIWLAASFTVLVIAVSLLLILS